jgi:predicted negative regulator of RcsB-dependent stress response
MESDQTDLLKRMHYLLRNIELLLGLILVALVVFGVHFWQHSN